MKRLLSPWLLLLVCVSGCIGRERLNGNCGWTDDAAFPLDLRTTTHQQHLVRDAQLAEELAIRYADSEHKRLFGYEGHGGLIENGRVRDECMATLVNVIEKSHAVTSEQILHARGQRSRTFDMAVLFSFVALYWFGAMTASRWICRRFSTDERLAGLVATILASVAVSAVGVQFLALWSVTWEMIRVGNDHLGDSRAARIPWGQHLGELFIAGVLLFGLIALLRHRPRRDDYELGCDPPDRLLFGSSR